MNKNADSCMLSYVSEDSFSNAVIFTRLKMSFKFGSTGRRKFAGEAANESQSRGQS